MALEGSFKVLDGVDQELKNRYGQAFLNPCGAERERPPALGKAVIKSGGIHLLHEEWRRDRDSNPR